MADEVEVVVPDIGEFDDVDVIEVLVRPGDQVEVEQSLITLESDKATMEIPATAAGTVKSVDVAVGDKVSEGARIVTLTVGAAESHTETREAATNSPATKSPEPRPPTEALETATKSPATKSPTPERPDATEAGPAQMLSEAPPLDHKPAPSAHKSHASPAVRRLAHELGVELPRVTGSGRKGRILKEDVQNFVKQSLKSGQQPAAPSGFAVPEMPPIDYSKWGEIELAPLNKLRRVSARNLHRAWLNVPHVTQHDEADITELEAFRKSKQEEARARSSKLTLLGFFLKACASTIQDFPHFNSSLDRSGEALVMKKYIHIGIAVDTEQGLVVPVIRDVDKKGLFEIADELAVISQKARDRKLRPADLQGGTFTISSLGGIGGTAFTPIVNSPEVAILGVSRSSMKPVWDGERGEFVPRLIVPLSLSYDHRVIDGADAARFTTSLQRNLSDIRNLIL